MIIIFSKNLLKCRRDKEKKKAEKWNQKNNCQDELVAHFWYECWRKTFRFWRDRREVPFVRIHQMAAKSQAIWLVRQVVNFHRLSLQAGSTDGFCVWKTDVLFTVSKRDNKSSLSCQPALEQTQKEITMCCWCHCFRFFGNRRGKARERGI